MMYLVLILSFHSWISYHRIILETQGMSKSLYRVQLPIKTSIWPILNRKLIHVHFLNSHAIFLHNTMLEMHVNMLRIDVLLEIRRESKFSSLQNGFIHRTQQHPLLLQFCISAPTLLDKICLFRSPLPFFTYLIFI